MHGSTAMEKVANHCCSEPKLPIARDAAVADRFSKTTRREHMCWIPGGTFQMGSNTFYREERPVRSETVG
jgi:formylglycine-generating enzyme required for sulfatase activity